MGNMRVEEYGVNRLVCRVWVVACENYWNAKFSVCLFTVYIKVMHFLRDMCVYIEEQGLSKEEMTPGLLFLLYPVSDGGGGSITYVYQMYEVVLLRSCESVRLDFSPYR
jgi:hypothetical protein